MNTDDIVWRVHTYETVLGRPGFCVVTGEYRAWGNDFHQSYVVDLRDETTLRMTYERTLLRAMNSIEVALLRAVQTGVLSS